MRPSLSLTSVARRPALSESKTVPFDRVEHMRRVGLANRGKSRPRTSLEEDYSFSSLKVLFPEYGGPDSLDWKQVQDYLRENPLDIYDLLRLSSVLLLRVERLRDRIVGKRKNIDSLFLERVREIEELVGKRVKLHESLLRTKVQLETQERESLESQYLQYLLTSILEVLHRSLGKCPHCQGDLSMLRQSVSKELRQIGQDHVRQS